jgi:hypothetical protein
MPGREPDGPATEADDREARRLAERFAPVLYFDANERWFPTDPRPYQRERGDETIVDGFDAFDGYTRRYEEADEPPDLTVFYRVVRYDESPLAVVQFWYYSAFDQFTTNFHWHDWEVVHVFVDTESTDPQLYVASAHSRKVPNNEYLDPDPETVPRVLSELGSHSSTLSLNDRDDSFQRLPTGGVPADITNRALDVVGSLAEIPAAYGLPRDEGARLPYLVPELDGGPVYEHERLPAVSRSSLVADDLTVRSFDDLSAPPSDLPARETGVVFDLRGRAGGEGDVAYELLPTAEVEHIGAFTGPQLSFEFAIPAFAEDAVADHITTTSAPWTQPRYDNPAADVTDPAHRSALADRYEAVGEPSPGNAVVAAVSEAVQNAAAPDGEGLTTERPSIEAIALLQSDPVAVPTFGGIVMVRDVDAGDHRLTINGAGLAPHSERTSVTDGDTATVAGVDGEIPLVAAGDAVKLRVDPGGADGELTNLAVEDDFAGRLYDAPLDGPDVVYVHRGGAYTTEVRDAEGAIGAFRVNPADGATATIDRPRTGKASLAEFLATLSAETGDRVAAAREDGRRRGSANAVRGLVTALGAVGSAAERAAERARGGDRGGADRALRAVASNIERTSGRLDEARGGLPDPVAAAVNRRLDQARKRADQALASSKL